MPQRAGRAGNCQETLGYRQKYLRCCDCYTMSWPPQASDLTKDEIKIGDKLESFLNAVLSGQVAMSNSDKVQGLKLSIGQDIVHAVSRGRVRIPKSILFPYAIKSSTNNTKPIKITNRLGYGVKYDLLEELETENAYRVIGLQENGLVLPERWLGNTVLMLVADNIDSGRCS